MQKKIFLSVLVLGSLLLFSCSVDENLFVQSVRKVAPKRKEVVPSVAAVSSEFIDPFGDVLITEAGKPLYTYAKDSTSKSNCYGECAIAWPPFLIDDPEDVSGDYSSIERTDGTLQVTLNGQPLYTYVPDMLHTVTGDGMNDVWDVVLVPNTIEVVE